MEFREDYEKANEALSNVLEGEELKKAQRALLESLVVEKIRKFKNAFPFRSSIKWHEAFPFKNPTNVYDCEARRVALWNYKSPELSEGDARGLFRKPTGRLIGTDYYGISQEDTNSRGISSEDTINVLAFKTKDKRVIESLKHKIETGTPFWTSEKGKSETNLLEKGDGKIRVPSIEQPLFSIMTYYSGRMFDRGQAMICGIDTDYELANSLIRHNRR